MFSGSALSAVNNSLKNEAAPVHVNFALQEVAAHLKHSAAKCWMKAALTRLRDLKKKKEKKVW